jgi:hypothetical protein
MTWSTIGRIAPMAALLALAGCRDGGTGPTDSQLSLEIRRSAVPVEEETIGVGDTIRLSFVVRSATGRAVEPQPRAAWRSDAQDVATVDSTGTVRGVQLGTARIIATAGAASDTVRINVAGRVQGAVTCEGHANPLRLTPGQVFASTADQAVTICIEGGTARSEYALVAYNASDAVGASMPITFNASGTVPAFGPPSPNLRIDPATIGAGRDLALHGQFRERSRQALEPRLRAGIIVPPLVTQPARLPRVGDLMNLNVQTAREQGMDGCSSPQYRAGRVVAVTRRAIVVADTSNPRGQRPQDVLTDDDYQHFGETLDTLVWRVNTANFGEPTDIDGNERVIMFFTRAVNELTTPRAAAYVAGFFYNRDLFPRTGNNACAGSNYAEMFYLMVPDPQGTINQNVRSRQLIRNTTMGVIAHEFQHLINDSRRLYVNRAPVWEETWLNEGLSHIAEELVFYAVAGLSPRSNLGPQQISAPQVNTAFNHYARENIQRFAEFLQVPHEASLIGGDNLPTRGAAWAFLRYVADRVPGNEEGLWRALVNSQTQGLSNLRNVLGTEPRDWIQDWALAVYLDDVGLTTEARYSQPSWNFRTLMPTVPGVGGTFPLGTIQMQPTVRQTLQGGGMAYVRFGVGAGQTAGIRTLVNQLPAPSRLRIAVVRTR